ncbi:MAG: succinylglutamate desuccinylase/aspartoacylase family protein, partial [Pirellulaceae bacterium]|nr:succinylglutamate desuccinylase/aspartoacylase family protein [Pirellulaceae bacterium]
MTNATRISTDVDFDQDGKQCGFLQLPHSVHRSAYGWIPIPVISIKNGEGPRVLMTGGNHGDEYEGQLSLMKLARQLTPADVRGRIIIIPSLNYPAALAGTRTSPIDGGNLNRSFPGGPDGAPTAAIAHYVEHDLLPMSDYSIDLHSGGSSLMYIPSALMRRVEDQELFDRQLDMLRAFGAKLGYIAVPDAESRTLIAAAERTRVAALGTELGGAGSSSVESLRVAELGIRRVLNSIGSAPDIDAAPPAEPTRIMEVRDSSYFVYSPDYGMWEPYVELGDEVAAGQPAAAVHSPQTPWREPVVAKFARAGTVICKRMPGG